MPNLKRRYPNTKKTSRPSMGQGHSTETDAFKKDIQLLERAILKKVDEKPVSSGNLLAIVLREQSKVIKRLTPQWRQREVMRAIRRVQQEIGRENADEQYALPGFEGFPKRVRIAGRQPHFAKLKLPDTVAFLESLEAQEKRDIERIAKVRTLVDRQTEYARTEPEITVREVCERDR